MAETVMRSDDVRQNWREVLDNALLGGRVIVERYAKPLAVLINYKQYQEMKDRLSFLEAWAQAHQIDHDIESGKTQAVTLEQHKARMQTKGASYGLEDRV